MIFQTIFMYLFISSVCLVYGVGLRDIITSPDRIGKIGLPLARTIITTVITMLISGLLIQFVLLPYSFQIVFPLVILIILVIVTFLLEHLWPSIFVLNTREITLSFFAVFLSLSEGAGFLRSIIISITAIMAFYLLLFFLYCVNRKNASVITSPVFNNVSLMLITMACIILALYGWNVSWLNDKIFN